MKNITLTVCMIALAGTLALFSSCSKFTNVELELTVPLNNITYGPSSGQLWQYSSQTFNSKLDSLVTANGGSLDSVKSINAKALSITAIAPSTNFNQFDYAEAYIGNGTDSIKIFHKNPIPKDSTTVNFDTDNQDISSFVKASTFKVSVRAFNPQNITTSTLSANLSFKVTIGTKK